MNPDQLSPHDRETPNGWVLVPVEPTDAMTRAAVVYANGNAVYKNVAAEALRIEESIYAEVYAAMLAARPSPPASQQEAEPLNSAGETPTEHAHRWATNLAVNIARKHYPEAPQFRPLPDLLGVITQLDNMTCGMVRKPPEADAPPKPANDVLRGYFKPCNGGRSIDHEDSEADVLLRIDGNWENDQQCKDYAQAICDKLNWDAPQAADAGVTDEQLWRMAGKWGFGNYSIDAVAFARAAIALSRTASSADGAGEQA